MGGGSVERPYFMWKNFIAIAHKFNDYYSTKTRHVDTKCVGWLIMLFHSDVMAGFHGWYESEVRQTSERGNIRCLSYSFWSWPQSIGGVGRGAIPWLLRLLIIKQSVGLTGRQLASQTWMNTKVLSGDRARIRLWPFITSKPATRLIRTGPLVVLNSSTKNALVYRVLEHKTNAY